MPWARFDTDTIRSRFCEIPKRDRPQAIAGHEQAVFYSAELLLDGRLSPAVWAETCEEVGISNAKRIADLLVAHGLFKRNRDRSLQIVGWEEFHSSREDVFSKREYEAEKKRRARGQTRLPVADVPPSVPEGHRGGHMSPGDNHGDVPPPVPAGLARATRAVAEAAAEIEKGTSGSPPTGWPADPLLDPAAAAADAGPTEPQLTKLLQAFPDADRSSLTVIQPLAQALPAQTVLELAWQLRGRKKPGGIGLLVDRLRDTIRERIATAAVENGQPAFDTTSRIERLKRDDPEAYLTALAPSMTAADVTAYLDRHVPDDDHRFALADLAANLRREHLST